MVNNVAAKLLVLLPLATSMDSHPDCTDGQVAAPCATINTITCFNVDEDAAFFANVAICGNKCTVVDVSWTIQLDAPSSCVGLGNNSATVDDVDAAIVSYGSMTNLSSNPRWHV